MATYAIVKTGGKQYKVAVGDVVKVEKRQGHRQRLTVLKVTGIK
jgi:ribosomal protein L21